VSQTSTTKPVRLGRVERRAQIVEAALAVFADRDPADVAFEEVADAAGVSRALVYNYFGDRAGLLEAVYRHHADALALDVARALAGSGSVHDALTGVVRAHLGFARRSPAAYRLVSGDGLAGLLPQLGGERLDVVGELILSAHLVPLVAWGLMSSLEAMVRFWVTDGGADLERAAEAITDFLWKGLSGGSSGGRGGGRSPCSSAVGRQRCRAARRGVEHPSSGA